MEPQPHYEPTPHDLAVAGLIAAAAISAAISADDACHDDALAFEFLRTAWPTVRAQNQ